MQPSPFPLCPPALPPPGITIRTEGNPIAGQQYSLICTVTVVEDLVVEPSVAWLNSNDDPVSGEDITVGNTERMGTTTTLTLVFQPLHTSHGGAYTCRASISVAEISLSDLSSTSSADVNVASKLVCQELSYIQAAWMLQYMIILCSFGTYNTTSLIWYTCYLYSISNVQALSEFEEQCILFFSSSANCGSNKLAASLQWNSVQPDLHY